MQVTWNNQPGKEMTVFYEQKFTAFEDILWLKICVLITLFTTNQLAKAEFFLDHKLWKLSCLLINRVMMTSSASVSNKIAIDELM